MASCRAKNEQVLAACDVARNAIHWFLEILLWQLWTWEIVLRTALGRIEVGICWIVAQRNRSKPRILTVPEFHWVDSFGEQDHGVSCSAASFVPGERFFPEMVSRCFKKILRETMKTWRLLHVNLLSINLWNYRFTLIYCTRWSSSLAHLRWSMTSSRPESYHKKFLPLWSFLGQVFWHPAIQVHSITYIYIHVYICETKSCFQSLEKIESDHCWSSSRKRNTVCEMFLSI